MYIELVDINILEPTKPEYIQLQDLEEQEHILNYFKIFFTFGVSLGVWLMLKLLYPLFM